jgi:hypothetical protein
MKFSSERKAWELLLTFLFGQVAFFTPPRGRLNIDLPAVMWQSCSTLAPRESYSTLPQIVTASYHTKIAQVSIPPLYSTSNRPSSMSGSVPKTPRKES